MNLAGICCTSNEMLMRQGIPSAGNFLHQELAILTGAVEAMVVDVQCIMQALVGLAENFHTEIITTSPKVKITGATHIEFDEHHALDHGQRDRARSPSTTSPTAARSTFRMSVEDVVPGFCHEYINYMLGGIVPGFVPPAERCHLPRPHPRRGGRRGLQQPAQPAGLCCTWTSSRELLKNDVLVVETGCGAIASREVRLPARRSRPGSGRPGPARGLRDDRHPAGAAHGLVRGQHPHPHRADPDGDRRRPGRRHQHIPAVGLAPEWMSEKALAIATYCAASGATSSWADHRRLRHAR